MISALLQAVGKEGVLLMPTFTASYLAGFGWTQAS